MSITDVSPSIDTTWTETGGVAFQSGTLATIDDCITEVESKLKRGTLTSSTKPSTTEVIRWLVRAKQELIEFKNFTFRRRYAYADLTVGSFRISLPPDYAGGRVSLRDLTNDRPLKYINPDFYDTKWPDPSYENNDDPIGYTIKNMEVWIIPPPGNAARIELEYGRSGADQSPQDFSYLPEIERFRCCDYAVFESFTSLHMWQQAQLYLQRWDADLGKAKRADGRRRWAEIGFRCGDFIQDYKNANNQYLSRRTRD